MATVLLTQPAPRVDHLADQVQAAGFTATRLSFSRLITTASGADELKAHLARSYERIILVSPSAVWFCRDQLSAIIAASRDGLSVIGAGTEAALRCQLGSGLKIDTVIRPIAAPYDADALLALPVMSPDVVKSALIIRGEHGRDDWINSYRARGVNVAVARLYARQESTPSIPETVELERLSAAAERVLVLVTSVAHAARLCSWSSNKSFQSWLREQPCMVSHPRVAQKLTDGGFEVIVQAPADDSMVSGAIQWWRRQPSH